MKIERLRSARVNSGVRQQKPVTLVERIIQASSNEGDVVLDPFCGCGTTIAAAHAQLTHKYGQAES